MSQVLEVAKFQDDSSSTTEVGVYLTLPHSLMSCIQPKLHHIPEYAATTKQHREGGLDHICRTNPFLLAFSG